MALTEAYQLHCFQFNLQILLPVSRRLNERENWGKNCREKPRRFPGACCYCQVLNKKLFAQQFKWINEKLLLH